MVTSAVAAVGSGTAAAAAPFAINAAGTPLPPARLPP